MEMESNITSAMCALTELFVIKLKKLEDEMNLLLSCYALEECSVRHIESLIRCLLLEASFNRNNHPEPLEGQYPESFMYQEVNYPECASPPSEIKAQESKKNVYTPKYEWTEERTERLLQSVQRHYSELVENKDYAKPIWEMIRAEVDSLDPNLKWYTCRHKWSHLATDYNNYIKDLRQSGKLSTAELIVYVPQYYERIGSILRSDGDPQFEHNRGSTVILQKVLEDRLGKALKSASWEELGKREEDEDLITITGINIG